MKHFPFQVIYEDNHLIMVNKEPGVLVQDGDDGGDLSLETMVKEYVRRKYNKPGEAFLGVVHRIDRPVSGLVIFARTSKGLERMNALFRDRQIKKVYWALVGNRPPEDEGTLIHWLKKDPEKNRTHVYESEKKGGQYAELHYTMKGRIGNFYLLEIELVTGRPHQIRAQLGKIGCPIKGDVKYGAPEANKDGFIHLHSRAVEFMHPVKKEPISVFARLPVDDTWRNFENM